MKRVIVDYKKLNDEILELLVAKFPEGYGDEDIIKFKNALGEQVEAIEVRTEEAIYLVKIGKKLQEAIKDYEDENDFEDEESFLKDDLELD